ncbi:bifunctional methylenetetrahydrofolate dehydrogenase/methenyltetrahydrofolate cyclohydrolase FolD [Bacillus horti]|uniref:Bifunctional protein FolD n=1 Tax=Caldalkalibacillus horti TaxID=77523 RepID=A0ABT9W0V4_9BACI|nr:bifunctional methylenetetrahydrofolate dehydrogenase/methenyltetrahydrofolate cyclohydrolase FolD [Bacillus horti]MDQ0166874.1 methylenetetrahydrofolate dehydrogenase (NADP+)/methenyltetrahydrofolate cyclohydrolase [Bacillus horti]
MSAKVISGIELAKKYREEIKAEVEQLQRSGVQPGLTVILVGEDPASMSYVAHKAKDCEKVGIASQVIKLPEQTTQEELLEHVERLNADATIHGILVQLPLPKHISEKEVLLAISPDKDVDCFHPTNVGQMVIGNSTFLPCTPFGVVKIIQSTGVELAGKHVVVIGRSNIVGKPVSLLMLQEHATVTICHSKTTNLAEVTKQADVLIVAAGRPNMIKREHVSPGTVVIDVGVSRTDEGRLVGDVQFDEVSEVASYITPVPGGVGPMTRTMLLKNTLEAAKQKLSASLV